MGAGPLAGLRVVEMAGIGPCPLAGQLLGDLGADVVVVDRKSGKPDPTDINRRSKRSVAVDLKHPDGVETVLKLVECADILIEGFRPGTMERLGLGPKDCAARQPDLIYGRMTGWGQEGPLSQTAGHDIGYLAITGALAAIGPKDGPVPPLNMVADYAGGTMFLIMGVLAALHERSRSGKGQVVDVAMSDAVPLLAGLVHTFRARDQWTDDRADNILDGGAPFYRCYATSDGKHVAIGSIEPHFFAELLEKAGLPAGDAATQYDRATWDDKHDRYAALFATKTRAEWEAVFEGSDACMAPVLSWDEAPDHPHNLARNVFGQRDGVMQANPAPRFDRTPAALDSTPATAGADTDAVLEEIGIDAEECETLRASGALT